MKHLLWPFGAVSLYAMTLPALAQADRDFTRYGHPHMGWGYDGYGSFFGPIFMLVILAGLVLGVVALIRWLGYGPAQTSTSGALDTLNMRFAKGEIDAAEYEERKKMLQG